MARGSGFCVLHRVLAVPGFNEHSAVNWPSGTFCGVATGVKRDVAKGSKRRQAGGARPQGAESNSAEGAGRKEQVR